MEDLHRAGGLTPILRQIEPMLHMDCLTITGARFAENVAAQSICWPQEVVRAADHPIVLSESMVVLGGNLAPEGALLKTAAASAALLAH